MSETEDPNKIAVPYGVYVTQGGEYSYPAAYFTVRTIELMPNGWVKLLNAHGALVKLLSSVGGEITPVTQADLNTERQVAQEAAARHKQTSFNNYI